MASETAADPERPPPLADGALERLVRFLPTFEDPEFIPGDARGGKDDSSGLIQWPWFDYAPTVNSFEQTLYRDGWIVAFDWGVWKDKGRALVTVNGIESADLDDLRWLLTVIFRKERYCDGTVEVAFGDGTLLRIIRRISQLNDSPPRL